VNGAAVKASRDVRPGDTVAITRPPLRMTVTVRALGERRGPAREAALLYEETAESRAARERAAAERRLAERPVANLGGRPTKRDRRRYERTRRPAS
jgi:ribosome-associated heat shock protein Hsp15